jgi:Predicted RNA-binding protein containing a PIN domain
MTARIGWPLMKQLILDGYNIIHELPVLKKNLMLSLEDARTALVNFMQIWINNHAYRGKINIIFDGTDGLISNSQAPYGINCIYTKSGQKADDYIICMIRETKNRTDTTVVSNDKYIRGTCSSLGAATERPSFLIDSPKLKIRKINSQKTTKKISPVQEKEINEFLKEKWGIE